MIDAALVVTLFSVLLTVLCSLWLKAACPVASHASGILFSFGSVPPYRGVRSLRPKFLVPWVVLPDLSECRPSARVAINCARAAAALSLASLLALGLVGVLGNRA
jgi:hypothetical protein